MLDEKDLQAIAEMMKGMESRIDQKLEKQKQEILDESARCMKLLLDTEVTTRFNLLAEGQQAIMDAITPKSEIEQIRSEMAVLKLAVRTLSQDLAELKKAQ
jgi:hypothetical protein